MSHLGEELRVAAIRFERTLPGPVETVWARLTECDQLTGWFGEGGVIEPREGGQVRCMDSHIRGVVTQWEPNRRLAYTWNVFTPGETESAYPESYLSFELIPEGQTVKLVLLHLPVLEQFEKQNAMGWHTFLDILSATLSGEAIAPRGEYMQRNAARYGVDMNNLQR
jgi:uncharacterized protein YndB with AHSA1/START domain